MNKQIVFNSKSVDKGFWLEYSIYEDRLELVSMIGKLIIPMSCISYIDSDDIELEKISTVRLVLKNFRLSPILGWNIFVKYITIYPKSNYVEHILITPDKPEIFCNFIDEQLDNLDWVE